MIANEINNFAVSNNMKLNPGKCKQMRVSFLRYDSCEWQPFAVGGICIEAVQSFKLLGVYITVDLSWSIHSRFSLSLSPFSKFEAHAFSSVTIDFPRQMF